MSKLEGGVTKSLGSPELPHTLELAAFKLDEVSAFLLHSEPRLCGDCGVPEGLCAKSYQLLELK